jgi:hypothetical protein
MSKRIPRLAAAVGVVGLLAIAAASAQMAPNVRVRGTIEKAEFPVLDIKTREGSTVKVKLPDNVRVVGMSKATLADIKPNSYIGVTAMPLPDGTQRAIAIHIFMEAQRGTAEGHVPWDARPGSTMTNAAVETTVAGVDGQVITVKYKDGDKVSEKKVVVPADAVIVAYAPGDKAELKAGAPVFIARSTREADGTLAAPGISVGRGITPPM